MKCWHDDNLDCLPNCELIENCPDRERMLDIREATCKECGNIGYYQKGKTDESERYKECINFLEYLLTAPVGTRVVAYRTMIKDILAKLKEDE